MVLATAYRRQKVSATEPPAIGYYKASKRRYLQLGFAKIQTLCRPPPPPADLGSKHRAEPVPTETRRLTADIDAALEQQFLDLRERISDVFSG
jgi:hypothetical protein